MFKLLQQNKRGFTLVELLVVISIISLLLSTVLAAVSSARAKGVVAAQQQIVEEYRKALELYYSDNGTYPITASYVCLADYSTNQCQWGLLTHPESTILGNYLPSRTPLKHVSTAGFDFDGPIYSCVGGVPCPSSVMAWVMPGNDQKCGGGGLGSNLGQATVCSLTLTP